VAAVEEARRVLEGARSVLVLTGAGISAESGVPTFRGEGGLWRRHRPEELATPEAFARDPVLVWSWYRWRRELVAKCAPNAGHRALAHLALSGRGAIVTQNVDGLHERAAAEAAREAAREAAEEAARAAGEGDPTAALPLTLHGALFGNRCTGCGRRTDARTTAVDATAPAALPRCPAPCGALLRPDVVWFGEALDADVLQRAFALAEAADVCLVVGTSAAVQPAASIPLGTLRRGGVVIEVNPEPTPLTPHATASLHGPAGTLLPDLLPAPEVRPRTRGIGPTPAG
jgi:NAD-dependent deacetylase